MNTTALPSARVVAAARRAVCREYPAVRRIKPEVKAGTNGTFTLTFRTSARLPDGATLHQTVRATVNERGEVLRVVTSR